MLLRRPPDVLDAHQTIRATGATARQLRHWRNIGLCVPSVQQSHGRSGVPNLYAPRDVARVLAVVELQRAGMSLQTIRRMVEAGEIALP